MNIYIVKNEDGFWLMLDGELKAGIHLEPQGEIVTAALEEAAQQSVQPTLLESGQIEDHNFVSGICTFCGKAQTQSG